MVAGRPLAVTVEEQREKVRDPVSFQSSFTFSRFHTAVDYIYINPSDVSSLMLTSATHGVAYCDTTAAHQNSTQRAGKHMQRAKAKKKPKRAQSNYKS